MAGGVQVGAGVPDGSTAVSYIYINSATGDIYTNPTLTAGDWVLATGGGGGAVQIYSGAYADPNVANLAPADTTKGAIFYQNPATTVYNVWLYSTTTHTWSQFSAP